MNKKNQYYLVSKDLVDAFCAKPSQDGSLSADFIQGVEAGFGIAVDIIKKKCRLIEIEKVEKTEERQEEWKWFVPDDNIVQGEEIDEYFRRHRNDQNSTD